MLAISESIVEIKRLLTEAILSDDNIIAVDVSIIDNFDMEDAGDGRTKKAGDFVTKADDAVPPRYTRHNRLAATFRTMIQLMDGWMD